MPPVGEAKGGIVNPACIDRRPVLLATSRLEEQFMDFIVIGPPFAASQCEIQPLRAGRVTADAGGTAPVVHVVSLPLCAIRRLESEGRRVRPLPRCSGGLAQHQVSSQRGIVWGQAASDYYGRGVLGPLTRSPPSESRPGYHK